MLFFFRQFSSLTHSGITLYGALDNLAARTSNPNLARTAREMSEVARNGGMISDVMVRYPAIYPDHVTGMMRAGETGGFVDMALTEIADGYDANIKLYRAAWIPKTMALQAFLMLPIVIPFFPIMFRSFEWQANLVTYFKVLMFVSLPISGVLLFLMMYAARRLQLPKYRYLRDSWSLKIPALGNLQREVAIRTFLRMLGRLYHAGIMPIHAWEGAMNTASNVVIRDQLARSYELMQSGSTLSDAFAATGLFANQVEQMVFTGQQSGQVVEMLDQATAYYEQRAEEATGKARFMMLRIGILAMLIFGGIAVCWMAQTYFGGIFKVVDSEFKSDFWPLGKLG
jgi:type IV pilus assembly protein PilC